MKYGWLQDRIQFRKEDFNNVRTFQICEYQAQKRKNDAAKGKIFTMIGREIAVAVKEGGPDPANNFKLAQVIAKAKSNNMPNDTIERGIKKAAGDGNSVNYETTTYEGYGPSGTAIIVKCLTDNKNRTAANVRNAFTKGQGSIGTQGCVSYMFDEKGQIIIDKEECDMDGDDLMMLALDAGAEDFPMRMTALRSLPLRKILMRYIRHLKSRTFRWHLRK